MKKILGTLLGLIVVGLAGFFIYAYRPSIAPVSPPSPASFSPELIARGQSLAAGGFCATCHTRKGGAPLAGGRGMPTPFGTIYATNITPDPETGIGRWSVDAFLRAMHEGVARDGSHLFPAFPYTHFTKLSDADVRAIYAYLMTQPAVRYEPPRNGVPFPLSIRAFQAGWKLLFFRPGRFTPDATKDPVWNRGAYLSEGLSHCSACHTARNFLGAEKAHDPYGGAPIDNWIAPALDQRNPSPVAWDGAELFAYLRAGVTPYHGVAAGPMAEVVHGLKGLPDSDVQAISVYFAGMTNSAARQAQSAQAIRAALAAGAKDTGLHYDPTARLYIAACASCHYNGPAGINPLRPELALNSAVSLDQPDNLIQVILHGLPTADGAPGVAMPAFNHFSDADIARLANYLRTSRTGKAEWPDLEKKVGEIRKKGLGE